ncbi:hypothetical protein GHT89_16350 [Acinetobacter baumannii]|uniref:hypothetical protein n=1 Tax=Acinetobacter baumannii TaxID=470 RepID=UPI00387DC655
MIKFKRGDTLYHEKQLNHGIILLRAYAVMIGIGIGLICVFKIPVWLTVSFVLVFIIASIFTFKLTMKHKKILDSLRK